MNDVGFLLNLSFPAEARQVSALHDVIVQAVRQAVEIYTHLARAYCSGDPIPAAHEEIQR